MIATAFWESATAMLTVMTPLVVVPLTMITFYLRSLRDQQVTAHGQLVRRVEMIEASAERLKMSMTEFERDYTTKEEWLRETMWARKNLEQLNETSVRLETMLITREPSGRSVCASSRRDTGPKPCGEEFQTRKLEE